MPVGTTNTVIAGCGSHHIAVQARNLNESLHLYRDVLGMRLVAEFGTAERPILLLDIGDGSHIELFGPLAAQTAEAPPHVPLMHIALTTTDARAATEHIRAAGYTVTVEPKDVQLGSISATIAFFLGPNGEIIEFFQTH
jgi:glyoxylase I family protein